MKRLFLLTTVFVVNMFALFAANKYCVEQITGIWRMNYNEFNLPDVFEYGLDKDCKCESFYVFNGINEFLSISDGVYNSEDTLFYGAYRMKYESNDGVTNEVLVRRYGFGFCDDNKSFPFDDISFVKSCGNRIVTLDMKCDNCPNQMRSIFESKKEKYPYQSGLFYYSQDSDEMVCYGEFLEKKEILSYRYIKAIVGYSVRDHFDYIKLYLNKTICVPLKNISSFDRNGNTQVGSFNDKDVLSIIDSNDKFYIVEFYKTEDQIDTCTVKKKDVVLLKDMFR